MFPILLGKTKELEAKCADLQRQIDEGSGGSSGDEILIVSEIDSTLDKTWQEIHDTVLAIIKTSSGTTMFIYSIYSDEDYFVVAGNPEIVYQLYKTDSVNGYPTAYDQPT